MLFQPMTFRSVTTRNRIAVAPMCQYSAADGLGWDWHTQNLGAKAAGGAGIVFTEATHVSPEGRITPGCLGLYNDAQQAQMAAMARLISYCGAVPGMQISHAGRKASSQRPWEGGRALLPADGGWIPLAASPIPFHDGAPTPTPLDEDGIQAIIAEFAHTARRALEAGFKVVEIHAAHGYLLHSFLSPISNQRNDAWGGDLAGRSRLLMAVIDAVRKEWPAELPLFVRLSCVDWTPEGLQMADAVQIARWLRARGDVDLIDCSTGGIAPHIRVPSVHPGYQVPFAETLRRDADIPTGAVGKITEPTHAEEILGNGRADLIFLARALLAEPGWPVRAALALGAKPPLPRQYERAIG